MRNNKSKFIAAAMLMSLGLSGIAGTAMADSVVDSSQRGTLVVHKYVQDATNGKTPGTGEVTTPTGTTLNDIKFKIQKVNDIDLSKNAGWEKAGAALKAYAQDGTLPQDLAAAQETTTQNGEARFSDLDLGLYVVTEELTENQKATIEGSKPFLVTLPMTKGSSDRTEWMYEVHTYPKNSVFEVTKTIIDKDVYGADDVSYYEVAGSMSLKGKSDKVKIVDDYPANEAFDTNSETTVKVGDTKLTVDDDYTLQDNGDVLTMELTAAGLEKAWTAVQANPQSKVVLKFPVKKTGEGEETNVAKFFPNSFVEENNPGGMPTTGAQSKWGSVKIKKVGAGDQAPLQGAKFKIYASHENNFENAHEIAGAEIVTTQTGEGSYDKLRYSNFADGAEVNEQSGKYNYYWLKEVQAPEGYQLLAEPIPFTVTAQAATAEVKNVTNVKIPAGTLPVTGANGAAVLVAAAAALGGAGMIAYRRQSKKQEG